MSLDIFNATFKSKIFTKHHSIILRMKKKLKKCTRYDGEKGKKHHWLKEKT